jgi:hypothetical protein
MVKRAGVPAPHKTSHSGFPVRTAIPFFSKISNPSAISGNAPQTDRVTQL